MSKLASKMLRYQIEETTDSAGSTRYRNSRLPTVAIWTAVALLIVGWVIFK